MNSTCCLEYCETGQTVDIVQHDSEVRVEKILSIRRELGEGRYYIADKLDIVVDRILEELLES